MVVEHSVGCLDTHPNSDVGLFGRVRGAIVGSEGKGHWSSSLISISAARSMVTTRLALGRQGLDHADKLGRGLNDDDIIIDRDDWDERWRRRSH